MDISGLLQACFIIYKEFLFLTHAEVYKSLVWMFKLCAPKIDKAMSKLL